MTYSPSTMFTSTSRRGRSEGWPVGRGHDCHRAGLAALADSSRAEIAVAEITLSGDVLHRRSRGSSLPPSARVAEMIFPAENEQEVWRSAARTDGRGARGLRGEHEGNAAIALPRSGRGARRRRDARACSCGRAELRHLPLVLPERPAPRGWPSCCTVSGCAQRLYDLSIKLANDNSLELQRVCCED